MTFVLYNVHLFNGHTFLPAPGYIHVSAGTIAAIGSGPPPEPLLASLPKGTPVLDKQGTTLIPGLIDAHIHANDGNVASLVQSLRFGVTTVCDMHNEHVNVRKLTELAARPENKSTHADFKTCGTAATIDGGWPEAIVTMHDKSEFTRDMIATWPKLQHPSEAPAYVAAQLAVGASYIKLMHEPGTSLSLTIPVPSLTLQKALVDAAHSAKLIAVAHALSLSATMAMLSCGIDGLTHTFFDSPPPATLAAAYRANNAHCNPTLAAIGSLTTEGQPQQLAFAADPLARRLLDDAARANLTLCMGAGASSGGSVAHAYASVRALHQAGVPVVVGSDAAGPARGTAYGLSVHQELRLLVHECGMSAEEALAAATGVTAERFGFRDRGVLEVGRRADLVLLSGDVVDCLEVVGGGAHGLCLPVLGVWREGVVGDVWEGVMDGRFVVSVFAET